MAMFNSFLMLCVCLPEGKTSQIRQISIHHHPPRDTLVWCAAWCLPCPCSRWGGFRAFADVSNCAAEVESQRERWFWNYLPLWIILYTWLVVLTILKIWKSMGRIIPNIMENKSHVWNHQPVYQRWDIISQLQFTRLWSINVYNKH